MLQEKSRLFTITALLMSIGLASNIAPTFANEDVPTCQKGEVAVKRTTNPNATCVDEETANRWVELGFGVIIGTEAVEEATEEAAEVTEDAMEEAAEVTEDAMEEAAGDVENTQTHPPLFMYVQSANSGTFTVDEDKQVLTLNDISKQTVYFSDRPDRIVGHQSTDEFINTWGIGERSFHDIPPNAAIVVYDAEEHEDTIIVELMNPQYDDEAQTLQYDVVILEDQSKATGLHKYHDMKDDTLPESFNNVALFIDSTTSITVFAHGWGSSSWAQSSFAAIPVAACTPSDEHPCHLPAELVSYDVIIYDEEDQVQERWVCDASKPVPPILPDTCTNICYSCN